VNFGSTENETSYSHTCYIGNTEFAVFP